MVKLVMTVDASPYVRRQVGCVLRPHGYEVVEAVNGKDALQQLEDRKVDLIVSDLEMPEVDGIALIEGVRAMGRRVPVVMLAARCHDGRRLEGIAAGAAGWIVKPCNPEQLISFAKKVLG
jgi:two-component system, chemotaxis family, chemotaxis protein CheY